jgi:N-acetylmuramoyl-L-alanine amidase CwlA
VALTPQYEFREMLLTPGRGGRPGRKITPKAYVLHWTANETVGADAKRNRDYFENHPQNKVSAHYVIDDHQVVQCVSESEMAYHVGAKSYKQLALERLSSYPNDCTIGIEMCVNRDGRFEQTYANTVDFVARRLHARGWWVDRLWRHFDITGKVCPRFWVDDGTAILYGFNSAQGGWQRFKADVEISLVNLQQAGIGVKTEKEVGGMFKDTQGHWAQKDIEEAAKLGLVAGKGDGAFDPDGNLTRAEAAVLLMRLYRLLRGE